MNEITSNFQVVIDAFSALSGWEVIATILGIIYVILAAKESFWCWPAAFFSTLIYTMLFWEGQLPMQALLNVYYMGMAVYGFILWRHHSKQEEDLQVSTWPVKRHILFIVSATLISLLIGYYLSTNTETRLPYLDSAVMVFSMGTTWMMAQKVLENWLYWLMNDTAAIILYWQTGYYVTIIMFMVYLVLAIYGYRRWKASYLLQEDESSTINNHNPNPYLKD